ncbi:PQQ-binding-like beta-propeller repeat protein [Stieleria sp. TO1_6]|uniref:outer membrane protein assembly factor BamB family protein n=1 Tax=Stieleria tagensis TaxID=2956795 RepID=UPI00209BA7BF|nr:PQQ-binding-like beta-propeller repeat protein [Stieleria tagensis]MCO8122136.1 PQQ-binding-like beta-propeller repeat protein [Stieleria tagensis]
MARSTETHCFNRRAAMIAGASLSTAALAGRASAAGSGPRQWWGWRGPDGKNTAAAGATPPAGIADQNVAWSVEVPGRGHSSPIVVDDSIYLTTADKTAGTQSVLAFRRDGKPDWTQVVHDGGIPGDNHRNNTEASPTLAYDGEGLFAAFYNSDAIWLTKLSTTGKIIWQQNIGRYHPNQYKYGYAASPLVYRDSVIINADFDGQSFLAAVDRRTGKPIWKVKRPGKTSFSSPIVANIAQRDQLLLSGGEMVAAYSPDDGTMLWKVDGAATMATCGTMVWDNDLVFASGGYPGNKTVCIAANGTTDDGKRSERWSNSSKCYEQSLLAHDGLLFAVADSGVAFCWRCRDGELMWRQRLGGKYSSSPLLVGDTLYVFSETGNGFAFAASPDGYKDRGQSKLGDEIFASPVFVDDTLYLRVAKQVGHRQEYLLAIR